MKIIKDLFTKDLFDRNKGILHRIANIAILLYTLIGVITLLSCLITTILPSGGNYDNFSFANFICNLLKNISLLIILTVTLYLINKKFKFFNNDFPLTKKIINFLLVMGTMAFTIIIISDCLEAILIKDNTQYYYLTHYRTNNYYLEKIKTNIIYVITYVIGLIAINKINIFTKKNNKSLNIFNFILFSISLGGIYSIFDNFLDIFGGSTSIIDNIRNTLIGAIVAGTSGVVLYFLNKENINNIDTKLDNEIKTVNIPESSNEVKDDINHIDTMLDNEIKTVNIPESSNEVKDDINNIDTKIDNEVKDDINNIDTKIDNEVNMPEYPIKDINDSNEKKDSFDMNNLINNIEKKENEKEQN